MLHSISFIFFLTVCMCVFVCVFFLRVFFFFGSLNMKFGPNDILS